MRIPLFVSFVVLAVVANSPFIVSQGTCDGQFVVSQVDLPATTARNMRPERGAATSVWCATSRRLEGLGGVYLPNQN